MKITNSRLTPFLLALFGVSLVSFPTSNLEAAPINPPDVRVVFDYINGAGQIINTVQVYSGKNTTGALNPTTATLFGGTGEMPLLVNGARARFSLYARKDTTDLTWLDTPLSTSEIYSWSPTAGLRWRNPRGSDQMSFLIGPEQPQTYQRMGYSGALPTLAVRQANARTGISRMDWPSFFTLAGSSTISTPIRNVILTRFWQPYNLSTWQFSNPVPQQISMEAVANSTVLKLPLNTASSPSLWNSAGMLAGPPGSPLATSSGRETYVLTLEAFSPDNIAGRELGRFSIDYWPQPTGVITVPEDRKVNGQVFVDGSDSWSPALRGVNIYPGGRVYARITGSKYSGLIPDYEAGPTDPAGKPVTFLSNVPQIDLLPPLGDPSGNYVLELVHEFAGSIDVLASQPYTVPNLAMRIRSNITELAKPDGR